MKIRILMTAILALALVTFTVAAIAQGENRGAGRQGKGLAQLTEEQKTQLKAKVDELKAAGAKPEEIRAATQELLKGWGIERPQGQGGRDGGRQGLMTQLTPEQREQLQAKMKEMREAGKTPQEVRAAMQETLKGWGIEIPQGQQQGNGGGREGLMAKLTAEQREQLQAKMKEMREAGKTPQEIRAATQELLKGWGIEAPQGQRGERGGRGAGALGKDWIGQLNEEQRTQLKAKIDELKTGGAKPEQIRQAIAELCKGWGIETPQGRGGQDGLGMGKLTQEQRLQVQAKVQEMKAENKTPEEIRAAIQDMLKTQPAPAQ